MKETQRIEWKESWRDEHLRSVCGFANAEGGVLVIGRNDKGEVVFAFSNTYRNLIEGPGKDPVDRFTPEVTPVIRLLRIMSSILSRRELQTALGLNDDEHFRKAYLLPALENGLIEMTIPDKPTSRLQKYRLT